MERGKKLCSLRFMLCVVKGRLAVTPSLAQSQPTYSGFLNFATQKYSHSNHSKFVLKPLMACWMDLSLGKFLMISNVSPDCSLRCW